MNKKIASETSIGLIFLFSLVFGYLIWRNGEIEDLSDYGQQKEDEAEIAKQETTCIEAGKSADEYSFGRYIGPKTCCDSLKKISTDSPENNKCLKKTDFASICSACGNGTCEEWENQCNCKEDCASSLPEGELGKKIEEIKSPFDGWLRYSFIEVDEYYEKYFVLFYPPDGEMKTATEFGAGPDRIFFNIEGKECWITVLLPAFGLEAAEVKSFPSEVLGGYTWGHFEAWIDGELILDWYKNETDPKYAFSVGPKNSEACRDSYKKILSTFKFIEQGP